jgi:hypothetical protein
MTTASINHLLVGAWGADLTYADGPREGEHERLRLTFLPDGVIVGRGRDLTKRRSEPPGAGEWTAQEDDRFSYWLNAVANDPSGRPRIVVHAHGEGTLAADGQTFTASGGSEFYGGSGVLLAVNRAHVTAIRAESP